MRIAAIVIATCVVCTNAYAQQQPAIELSPSDMANGLAKMLSESNSREAQDKAVISHLSSQISELQAQLHKLQIEASKTKPTDTESKP